MTAIKVVVNPDWLKACGHRNEPTNMFDVLETLPQRLGDGTRMFVINFHGRPWHLAEWRCLHVIEAGAN